MGLYLSLYIITCSIDCIDLHSTDAPSYSNAVLPTDSRNARIRQTTLTSPTTAAAVWAALAIGTPCRRPSGGIGVSLLQNRPEPHTSGSMMLAT